jgi:hypothetical protein
MFTLDEKAIEDAFFAAGFDDVLFDEGCVGRRAIEAAWEVVLDKGGRVKATRIRSEGAPLSHAKTVHGRTARVLVERSETTTVMFQLDDVDEFPAFLAALDHIDGTTPPAAAAQRSTQEAAPQEDIWEDEDSF